MPVNRPMEASTEALLRRIEAFKGKKTSNDEVVTALAAGILKLLLNSAIDLPGASLSVLLDLLEKDKKILRRWFKKIFPGLSLANMENNTMTFACLPYFEKLLRHRDRLVQQGNRNLGATLKSLGYEDAAVEEAVGTSVAGRMRRSPLEVCIAWLDSKGIAQAGTLRNAASSLTKSLGKVDPDAILQIFRREIVEMAVDGVPPITLAGLNLCVFCVKDATGILSDQAGHSVRHCREHAVSRIPRSRAKAWRDRLGRTWWAENNQIQSEQSQTEVKMSSQVSQESILKSVK